MKLRYRTLFISDVHLGTHGCQARALSRLLKRVEVDKLYLVGDIIDMARLKARWYWPAAHNDVVRRVLKLAKKGTEVIYIPGNHDAGMRQYPNLEFGGVKILPDDTHLTAAGQKLFITHGDRYDSVVNKSPALAYVGTVLYEVMMRLNIVTNFFRRRAGLPYWSLSSFLKHKVKQACMFMSSFEELLVYEAQKREVDGIVCGHIHKPELREATGDAPMYLNCGDWVESCTALVEHDDGRIELINGHRVVAEHREAKRRKVAAKIAAKRGEESTPIGDPAGPFARELTLAQ